MTTTSTKTVEIKVERTIPAPPSEVFGDAIPPEHVARHGFPDDVFLRRHAEWWQSLLSSYRMRLG